MLEPVEIDINMNQNVSTEAEKATAANEDMTKSVEELQKEIDRLEKVAKNMSTALEDQRKLTADNAGEFDNAIQKIQAMQEALTKAEQELAVYQNTLTQANTAIQAGADVSEVLSDAREGLAQTEANLVDNAIELISNEEDISEATDDSTESTEKNTIVTKLMSTAIKEVCKGLGIENTAIINAIGSTRTLTGIKGLWTNATRLLNTQLGITIGLSKLLVAGGIGLILVAIAAVVYAYKGWKEKQDEVNQGLEDNRRLLEKSADTVATQTTLFNKMQQEYNALGNSLQAKKKYIDDNKKSFDELGISVLSVNDADNLFIQNADAFREAIRKRAMAVASMELAAEKYKEAMLKMQEAEERRSKPTLWDKAQANPFAGSSGAGGFVSNLLFGKKSAADFAASAADDMDKASDDIKQSASRFVDKNIQLTQEVNKKLSERGINTNAALTEGSKAFYEAQKKRASEDMARLKDTEKDGEAWKKAVAEYNQASEKLKLWDIGGQNKNGLSAAKKTEAAEATATASLAKKAYDYQKQINEARVQAIREGAEKEREAAKKEYTNTQAFIEKELKVIGKLEKSTKKPATEQRIMLVSLDVEATRQYEAELARINGQSKKTLDGIFAEVNARFASELDQNLAEINEYYDKVIEEATKAGASLAEINELQDFKTRDVDRAGINDELRKIDLDEMLEMEKANNLASIGLTTIAEQTKFEIVKKFLNERIKLLRELGDEARAKEADILEERLKGMQSSPKSITGLVSEDLFKRMKKGFEKSGLSAEEAEKKARSFFGAFSQGGLVATIAIGQIQGVFGGISEEFDKALSSMGSIAEGFASGGIAGGVMATIGQGIKMFTHAAQVEKEHQKALKELALAKLELQREYNLLLLKEQLLYKQGSNIFGTDQIKGAVNAINTYRDTIRQLADELKGDKPELNINPFKGNVNKQVDEYKKKLQAYNDGIGALSDVDIVTGSRKSGWGFWKKQKDVYSGLLETYDDVIDSEGKLNTNRIQAILSTHKMSDENRALLESLLDLEEAAQDAEEQLRGYLNQTFGGLGDALADSIVQGFADGTSDGLSIFKGSMTDVLSEFSKQMIKTLFLKKIFDKLDRDIEKAYTDLADNKLTEEQLSEKITGILGGFFGGLGEDVEKANNFLEQFWKNAEANGFDRPDSERKGATGGFASASQDSINELSGGVYAVRQIVGDIRQDNREELLVSRTILTQMNLLVERSEYWEYLEELPRVAQKLEDIESYGLKMKI